ncbi:hypothetical protein [Vulcanisaeta moutnovskia]|uniref:hypothetical protein n=1 Tax=Vulcanisaeta moutnovskia TaxID=985052 RepID=UPI00064E5FF6|nr:hypothetical protein [Vulcanisaeta moutnovskia]
MPSKKSIVDKETGGTVVINFDNLYSYKYLSYSWFVRYALALTINAPNDPFEGSIDPALIKSDNTLKTINEKIQELLSHSKKSKVNSVWKPCVNNLTNDDLLDPNDFEAYVKINTDCFMNFEFKEYTRVFGGAGEKTGNAVSVPRAIAKLAKLGKALTYTGESYLFLDIDFLLQRNVYNLVNFFVRSINKFKKEISNATKLVGSAALIVDALRKEGLSTRIKDLLERGVVMYDVTDSGASMIDLTSIIKHVNNLRLASFIHSLTMLINYPIARDLLNKVSEAVITYTNTHSLLPVYEFIRYAITTLGNEEVRKELGDRSHDLIHELSMMGGLYHEY